MTEAAKEKLMGRAVWVLIGVGIVLRLNRYLCNFPFWGDEAWVAWDLGVKTFRDVFLNVNRDPTLSVLPLGFMLVVKSFMELLGPREIVLRFFPCACGVLGIFVFRRLLKRLVHPGVLLMAVALFVFSGSLLYYSSELKQYSSDILMSIAVYIFHFRALKGGMNEKSMLQLAIAGMAGLLFSLPVILVLCGISLAQVAIFYQRGQAREMGRYSLVAGFWLVWFFVLWFKFYQFNFKGQEVVHYQSSHYLSFPLSLGDWGIWAHKVFSVFQDPVGLTGPWLAALLFLAGCWSLRRKREVLLALVAPILLTIGLSVINKYPFNGRFLIFLLPAFYILIAQGVDQVMNGGRWRRMLGLAVLAVLLLQPIAGAGSYLKPSNTTDIRSLMLYIRSHLKPGDSIYYNNESQWGFYYYYGAFSFQPLVSQGVLYEHPTPDDRPNQMFFYISPDRKIWRRVYRWDDVVDDYGVRTRLPGDGRTWILLSQLTSEKEKVFLHCFDEFGKRVDEVKSHNAKLYLYDLK